jgi:signal transduction histidine kinase/ActR/RegA family two-component response regulator
MAPDSKPERNVRVLIAAPTRRDGEVTCALLDQAGVYCEAFDGLESLAAEIQEGVGALMLTDVALAGPDIAGVLEVLAAQPSWSDVPVILLTPDRRHSPVVERVLSVLTNVTVLDRPVSARSMVSAVLAALRARRRQYQLRDQMMELRHVERALRDADRRKDEFLATLAHELRNPLAPIRTGLSVQSMLPADSPESARVREMMQRQLRLLVKLIDDLLDVSRIATGKVVLQRERVDMRAIIESAIEGSQPAITAGSHTLQLSLPDTQVCVMGDPLRLAQVISNLINNAAKYTPSGGCIAVSLAEEAGEAVVRVSDDGVGIPPEMLEHVFDMFTQVDRTLERAQGGLGIGLSLVRRLMDLHGGSVSACSAGSDQGSTFTLRLPAVDKAAVATPRRHASANVGSRDVRVLVVDDNVDAADSLAIMLRLDGYEARVEYSGEDALRTAEDFDPDVVVCDIGLPLMDGHEIAKRLRADPRRASTVLVAVTGWGSEEDKQRTQRAGFDFHLVKPVGLDSVQEILGRLAAGRAATSGRGQRPQDSMYG